MWKHAEKGILSKRRDKEFSFYDFGYFTSQFHGRFWSKRKEPGTVT